MNKRKMYSRQIRDRIFKHDKHSGGTFSLITGSMGSGKTSALLTFYERTKEKDPNCKCFFSNPYNSPVQSFRLGMDKVKIFVKKDVSVTFHDRNNKGRDITNDIDITYFKDYKDLYNKASKDKCNTVFFGKRKDWMGFIHYLRSVGEWCSVFIDELSEIAPLNIGGKQYRTIGEFSKDLKEVRKCLLDVHCNTQAVNDIDWRVLTKVMVKVFLPGAKPDSSTIVYSSVIKSLKEDKKKGNPAFLADAGRFGKMHFTNFYEPTDDMNIEVRSKDE